MTFVIKKSEFSGILELSCIIIEYFIAFVIFYFILTFVFPLYATFRPDSFRETVVSLRLDLQNHRRKSGHFTEMDPRYKQRSDVSLKGRLEQKCFPG